MLLPRNKSISFMIPYEFEFKFTEKSEDYTVEKKPLNIN